MLASLWKAFNRKAEMEVYWNMLRIEVAARCNKLINFFSRQLHIKLNSYICFDLMVCAVHHTKLKSTIESECEFTT